MRLEYEEARTYIARMEIVYKFDNIKSGTKLRLVFCTRLALVHS